MKQEHQVESNKVYFEGVLSSRNLSTFGALFIVLVVISFATLILTAEFVYMWVHGISAMVCLIAVWLALKLVQKIVSNPRITMRVCFDGIHYGDTYISWGNIKKVYPRGGLTLLLKRRYQIGYTLASGLQVENELPIDYGMSYDDYIRLCEFLEGEVIPRCPNLRIKRPKKWLAWMR